MFKPVWILMLARDDEVTVSSAGPYANHLHLAAYITMPAPHHSIFYRQDHLPHGRPTNSVILSITIFTNQSCRCVQTISTFLLYRLDVLLLSPYGIGQTIIFSSCSSSSFFFSSPNLSRRRLDVSILPHIMWPKCEFQMQV